MSFFGIVFWIAVFWLAYRMFRRWNGCEGREHWGDRQLQRESGDDQQSHVDALESRVAELEERLDFTERLVAERRQVAS